MTTTVFIYSADNVTAYQITTETSGVDVGAGRNTELDEFDAGGGTISVHNLSRNFDPFFATSTSFMLQEDNASHVLQESADGLLLDLPASSTGSYGAMMQGRKIVVKDASATIFTGFIEDINYEWRHGKIANATIEVRDALAILARTTYTEFTRQLHLTSGSQINQSLARTSVSFPGTLIGTINTGLVPIQGGAVVDHGTNVLNDLQNIAKTEFGRLYVDRAGLLQFRDRYAAFGDTPTVAFNDLDNGSGLPFSAVEVTFGSELLYFSVSVDRQDGVVQTVTNTAAQAANPNLGARHLALTGLLFISDAYSLSLATYLADRYSTAQAVVTSLEIPLTRLGTTDRATVCGLGIGNIISVTWTPTGTGGTVTQVLTIEGWRYTVDHVGRAVMSLQLSLARSVEYLIYDTDAYDSGKTYAF